MATYQLITDKQGTELCLQGSTGVCVSKKVCEIKNPSASIRSRLEKGSGWSQRIPGSLSKSSGRRPGRRGAGSVPKGTFCVCCLGCCCRLPGARGARAAGKGCPRSLSLQFLQSELLWPGGQGGQFRKTGWEFSGRFPKGVRLTLLNSEGRLSPAWWYVTLSASEATRSGRRSPDKGASFLPGSEPEHKEFPSL